MADRDAEGQRAGLKDAAARAGRVGALFRRVDLHLVLKARERTVPIDNQGGGDQGTIDHALGSEDEGDVRLRGRFGDDGPGLFEEPGSGGGTVLPRPR